VRKLCKWRTNESYTKRGNPRGNVTEQQINTAIQAVVGAANANPKNEEATPTPSVLSVSSTARTPPMQAPATPVVAASRLKQSSEVAAHPIKSPSLARRRQTPRLRGLL